MKHAKHPTRSRRAARHPALLLAASLATGMTIGLLPGCAANPNRAPTGAAQPSNTLATQEARATALTGARFTFHHGDYSSLTRPNVAGCAGDAKKFYDPFTGDALETSLADSTETIRPRFIKNVSVDLTDANADIAANQAKSCSFGTGASAPAVSSCASFDHGAIGGIPSTLGGTLLMIGGIHGANYASYNVLSDAGTIPYHGLAMSCGSAVADLTTAVGMTSCDQGVWALGVNTLPASAAGTDLAPALTTATGPISTWAKLSTATTYAGPLGVAGAAIGYDSQLQRVALFGGVSHAAGAAPDGAGVVSSDTWTYDLGKQIWTLIATAAQVDTSLITMFDDPDATPDGFSGYQIAKPAGARALFGYAPVAGMALSAFDSNEAGSASRRIARVDRTDRLAIVGGLGPNGAIYSDTHLFNPTFGPALVDLSTSDNANVTLPAGAPLNYIDSYHTTLLSNSLKASKYLANFTPADAEDDVADFAVNFGMAPLFASNTTSGIGGTGYLLAMGGFDKTASINDPSARAADMVTTATCLTLASCGAMNIQHRRISSTGGANSDNGELFAANYTGVTNLLQPDPGLGGQFTPPSWTEVRDGVAAGTSTVPWYGGATVLPGIDAAANDVVYFGGTNCKNYLVTTTDPCTMSNPGRYWTFTNKPVSTLSASSFVAPANQVAAGWKWSGAVVGDLPIVNVPTNAGMAAARGVDNGGAGAVVIVAWGGMKNSGAGTTPIVDTSGYIYYLSQAGTGEKFWRRATASNGPSGTVNASMVYSHVTGKFYLFGGYSSLTGIMSADTWELSTAGLCAAGACTFTWKQLNSADGLTCKPATCPAARRSHRMAEVNYNNTAAFAGAPASGTQVCTDAKAPCSYGIFMEGGTADGQLASVFSDRWMFDPTANGGRGHWQKVDELPPRTLSAMAPVGYKLPHTGTAKHRAVMFGGETGMQSPSSALAGSFYVPPTLGDTWIYDYDDNTWHRAELLGRGYASTAVVNALGTEKERREGFVASTATPGNLPVLSPPALAGHVMVTRTLSGPANGSGTPPSVLPIPEVYVFGGRRKDGKWSMIDQVYKFCLGSTGERTGDGSANDNGWCDAYDETANSSSPYPSDKYIGRWLLKTPGTDKSTASGSVGATPSDLVATVDWRSYETGSYQGAGAYDPVHDRILLTGGMTPDTTDVACVAALPATTELGILTAVTDLPRGGLAHCVKATNYVYEYAPPSRGTDIAAPTTGMTGADRFYNSARAASQGRWTRAGVCAGSAVPTPRYGHSLSYDSLNQQLVMVGGYALAGGGAATDGGPLAQTMTQSGSSVSIPEVWIGKRTEGADATYAAANVVTVEAVAPCYTWTQVTQFGSLATDTTTTPPLTGLGNAASVFLPATGYNTGYYTTFDSACYQQGPIASTDPNVNKLLAGGAYIDIDRSALGPNENLVLNLTYFPLGPQNRSPDSVRFTKEQSALFKVHLVRTGIAGDSLRQVLQPRFRTYSDTNLYPEIVHSLSVLGATTGQAVQEQLILPISMDSRIDRIRIERYSGSAILIDASVFRMGYR